MAQDATRFAKLIDGQSILGCTILDDLLEYYVDEDLLARLSVDPRSDLSRMEQIRIFLDAASFLIYTATGESGFHETSLSASEGTIVDKFLRFLGGDDVPSRREWLATWKATPEVVLAAVDSKVGLRGVLNRVLASSQ